MTTEMLNKFDAILHFLPEFQMPIYARCYDKIGFGDHNMCDNISMHVTLLVTLCVRQIFHVQLFVFQN